MPLARLFKVIVRIRGNLGDMLPVAVGVLLVNTRWCRLARTRAAYFGLIYGVLAG